MKRKHLAALTLAGAITLAGTTQEAQATNLNSCLKRHSRQFCEQKYHPPTTTTTAPVTTAPTSPPPTTPPGTASTLPPPQIVAVAPGGTLPHVGVPHDLGSVALWGAAALAGGLVLVLVALAGRRYEE